MKLFLGNEGYNMDNIVQEVFKVMHRFHQGKAKFKGDGELANVEFYMLMGLAMMLREKEEANMDLGKEQKSQPEEEGITLREIIELTDMSMSAASKKVSILEKKGLIERNPSKTDRRNVYITLTEKGKEMCAVEEAKKYALVVELISRMGVENMKQLLILANKAFDAMDEIVKE